MLHKAEPVHLVLALHELATLYPVDAYAGVELRRTSYQYHTSGAGLVGPDSGMVHYSPRGENSSLVLYSTRRQLPDLGMPRIH